MSDQTNYTKEAFLSTGNLVFMLIGALVVTGTALVSVGPSWLFEGLLALGVGMELLYLGVVPRHPRFRAHVRSQEQAERSEPLPQRTLYEQLSRRSQRRYYRLRQYRTEIEANYRQLSEATRGLLDHHLQKIDGLLRSYLRLLHQRERYYDLTQRMSDAGIQASIEALEDEMADASERVRSVKEQRLDVLEKRRERIQKAHEHLEVIGTQLGAIEDLVKYIHEQSWTLQDAEEVTLQLDALMGEVDEARRSVQELEGVVSGTTGSLDEELKELDEELRAATVKGHGQSGERSPMGAAQSREPDEEG